MTEARAGGAPGDLVAGRYALLEPLASDRRSTLWRARDARYPSRLLDLLLCGSDLAEYSVERVMRFRLALSNLRPLDLPGIARVYEVGESGGGSFAALEPCRGPLSALPPPGLPGSAERSAWACAISRSVRPSRHCS